MPKTSAWKYTRLNKSFKIENIIIKHPNLGSGWLVDKKPFSRKKIHTNIYGFLVLTYSSVYNYRLYLGLVISTILSYISYQISIIYIPDL